MDNEIGKSIKYYRNMKGMSQANLAELLGVTRRNVSYYESGERIPPADVLKKLASIFETSVDELVGIKKMGSNGNCENYFYEEGLANWNIKTKAETRGLSYENVLDRTCIAKERFDLLWFGNVQPIAEELIRFSEVLDVSIDFLLDNSRREHITSNEELILLYYAKFPEDVMELLESFCSLEKRKNRAIVLGKCFELEKEEESVAADSSLKKTGTDNMGK